MSDAGEWHAFMLGIFFLSDFSSFLVWIIWIVPWSLHVLSRNRWQNHNLFKSIPERTSNNLSSTYIRRWSDGKFNEVSGRVEESSSVLWEVWDLDVRSLVSHGGSLHDGLSRDNIHHKPHEQAVNLDGDSLRLWDFRLCNAVRDASNRLNLLLRDFHANFLGCECGECNNSRLVPNKLAVRWSLRLLIYSRAFACHFQWNGNKYHDDVRSNWVSVRNEYRRLDIGSILCSNLCSFSWNDDSLWCSRIFNPKNPTNRWTQRQ